MYMLSEEMNYVHRNQFRMAEEKKNKNSMIRIRFSVILPQFLFFCYIDEQILPFC